MHDWSAKILTPPQTRAECDTLHAAGFSGREVVAARSAADLRLVASRGRLLSSARALPRVRSRFPPRMAARGRVPDWSPHR